MSTLVRVTDLLDSWLGRLCRVIILVSMLILLAVIGINVAARYLFERGGVNEVGEIPELLFPWLIAAGIIVGVQRGAHIAVDLITGGFSHRSGVAMIVFVNAIVIVTYGVLVMPVFEIAQITAIEQTPFLKLPRSIGFYSLAFAIVGIMFSSLALTLRVIARGAEAAPEFDPEESVT